MWQAAGHVPRRRIRQPRRRFVPSPTQARLAHSYRASIMLFSRRAAEGGPMPYKNAPYYVLACIAVIAAGFWPSYFGVWGEVPWQFHAHGVAASIWVLMVLA